MDVHVERHMKADVLNSIANDPYVRPWIAAGSEPLDLTFQVENRNNVLLVGEYGCCLFVKMMPGMYEAHTQVRKEGRGQWTNALTAACADYMFLKTDAYEIMTRVPACHIAARTAAIAAGMRYEFTREKECLFRGKTIDIHIYSGRLQDWLPAASTWVSDRGRAFHARLHEEAMRLGVTDPAHVDDENHNLYVGAAFEMATAGFPIKALQVYNRWAIASRHEVITPVSFNPMVVKIDHGLYVTFEHGDIKVSAS